MLDYYMYVIGYERITSIAQKGSKRMTEISNCSLSPRGEVDENGDKTILSIEIRNELYLCNRP